MALPITFATASSPLQLSSLDLMFAAVSAMAAIPCQASGTNTIALTPMPNAANPSAYTNLQLFSFIAAATSTGPVRAGFAALPQLNVYALDGMTQVGTAGIIGGQPYFLMFSQQLNGGVGGFYLLSFSTGQIVQPGTISSYAGAATIDPMGWYVCNGRAVSRSTDAALFAVCGTVYGPGDGSTTFNIPDFRGYFLRGLDGGAGVDPGRALGSIQQDQLQDHTHAYTSINGNVGGSGSAVNAGGAGASTGVPNTGNHGTETRPKNVAVPFIVKR